MAKSKYSDKQKAEAIKAYEEQGPSAASKATGIPAKTISSWAQRAGIASDSTGKRQAAIEASKVSFDQRRENLKHRILDEADAALVDMRKPYDKIIKMGEAEIVVNITPEPGDRAKLATAFGILFDKLQLSTGGSTNNTTVENPSLKALIANQNAQNEAVKAALVAGAANG